MNMLTRLWKSSFILGHIAHPRSSHVDEVRVCVCVCELLEQQSDQPGAAVCSSVLLYTYCGSMSLSMKEKNRRVQIFSGFRSVDSDVMASPRPAGVGSGRLWKLQVSVMRVRTIILSTNHTYKCMYTISQ